jgi:hypothetical protein
LPKQWVEKLFVRFEAMYGNKTRTMWGSVDADVLTDSWAEGLAGFGGGHLKSALDACLVAFEDYPPTLPQFRGLCKAARERERAAVARLPSPARSRDAFPAELVAMAQRMVDPTRKRDYRNWAREILVLADKGEYKHPLGIAYAKEALGLQ